MMNGRILQLLVVALAAFGGCTDTISGHGGSQKPLPVAPTLAGSLQLNGRDIALSWVPGAGDQTGYRLEVNTAPFGTPPYAGVFFVSAATPNYTYSATLPNTTYYFRVYAITGSAQSDPSNVISTGSGDFPLAPFYFTALAIGPNTVELRMLNGPTDTGNIIERSTDQITWKPIFNNTTGPNLRTVQDPEVLSPNTTYYYRGYAKINALVSDVSSVSFTRTQSTPGGLMVASGSGGVHSSLSFDDFLVQRIVSYDVWGGGVALTTGNWPPSTYSTSIISTGMATGYYGCSVATNNVGRVFVAAHVYQGDELALFSNQADISVFAKTTIDYDDFLSYDVFAKDPVIRVSPTDQSIHIVVKVQTSNMGDGHLRHYWRGPASTDTWFWETAVNYEPVLREHAFVIDGAGDLHIVYASQPGGSGPYALKHAKRLNGGGWTFANITTQGSPEMPSVTVGPSNSLHVAYKENVTGGLWYATNRSGPWTTEEVHTHTGDNIGRYNSILYSSKLSADVHIAYYELDHGNLWYAGKKGANGAWNRKLIDSANDVGRYTSIGTDGFDIYLTYCDVTNYWLKIIKNPQD